MNTVTLLEARFATINSGRPSTFKSAAAMPRGDETVPPARFVAQ